METSGVPYRQGHGVAIGFVNRRMRVHDKHAGQRRHKHGQHLHEHKHTPVRWSRLWHDNTCEVCIDVLHKQVDHTEWKNHMQIPDAMKVTPNSLSSWRALRRCLQVRSVGRISRQPQPNVMTWVRGRQNSCTRLCYHVCSEQLMLSSPVILVWR